MKRRKNCNATSFKLKMQLPCLEYCIEFPIIGSVLTRYARANYVSSEPASLAFFAPRRFLARLRRGFSRTAGGDGSSLLFTVTVSSTPSTSSYPSFIWERPTAPSSSGGLWRDRRVDVLLIPLVILALTYALSMSGQALWLTSIAMYAAVWHRGRQSLGVARFYQRGIRRAGIAGAQYFVPWRHLSADAGGRACLHPSGSGGI